MGSDRIPFEEAIGESLLLKNRFDELSFPQQVALKLLYGVPLSARVNPVNGFSELDYWSIFQGFAELDELGFPKKILPGAPIYKPQEYREGVMIIGRRAGKTDSFGATIVTYEATCGGHEKYLRPRQWGICFQIAQDLRMARNSLHFIRAALESSPLLAKEIVQITADRVDLKNNFSICCVPATLKSVRGFASPISVMDEVGVWYQESESANPDYEILRAVSAGQIQFPDARIVLISSPWNKAGLLYQYYEAGTEGYKFSNPALRTQYHHSLVLHGPTAVMGNPQVTPEYLERERQRDELAFEREVMARFQDSISGFLPASLVDAARQPGINEIPYNPKWNYHAAMDPAFKRDSFAFTIFHNEKGVLTQDCVRRFVGNQLTPLTPSAVLDVIVPLLKEYHLTTVYSDQYQLESLGQLMRERGIEIIGVTFTQRAKAQMYGNLQQLFLQRRIRLLDDYETVRELKSLERSLTGGGGISIAAPPGLHDDLATVVCLATSQAMWDSEAKVDGGQEPKEPTIQELIKQQIERKWAGLEGVSAWD